MRTQRQNKLVHFSIICQKALMLTSLGNTETSHIKRLTRTSGVPKLTGRQNFGLGSSLPSLAPLHLGIRARHINSCRTKSIANSIGIFVLLLAFFYYPNKANAYEYNGITFELMNGNSTIFYGLGIFTSDRRFTAGITTLIPTAMFSKDAADSDKTPDTRLSNRSYPFYSLSFYGNYNFIRTPRTVYFVGFGIQPLIPTKYVYNYSFGVEYFQSEATRFYFAFKNIYTNYVTDSEGKSSHLNRIAEGPQFLFGLKFAFLGKKRVKTKKVTFKTKTSKKKRPVKRKRR